VGLGSELEDRGQLSVTGRDDREPPDAEKVPTSETFVAFDLGESDGVGQGPIRGEIDDDQFGVGLLGIGVGGADHFGKADRGLLRSGMVDDQRIAFLHGAKILQRGGIGDAIPRGFLIAHEIGERVSGGFGFEKPGRHPIYSNHEDTKAQRV